MIRLDDVQVFVQTVDAGRWRALPATRTRHAGLAGRWRTRLTPAVQQLRDFLRTHLTGLVA